MPFPGRHNNGKVPKTMKKWLVGLMAAGLCVASAWATTDTLTADDFTATSTTYTEFSNVTKDSGAVYAGKSSKSKDGAIQLRSNGNDCGIVTTGSGGTVSKVTLAWNAGTAEAREVSVYGKTEAYTAASDLYSSETQGTLLGTLAMGTTELAIEGEYTYIGLRSKASALYLDSVAIAWGASGPSVSLEASATEVEIGETLTITATAKNFSGDVEWSWTGDDGGSADGATYTVNTETVGEYTITATATAGEETDSETITVTVTEVAVKYAVTVASGIENGTVAVDVTEAAEGDTVTVTATPADGYKLESITVNGEAITGNTFVMGAAAAEVSATFAEVVGETYTLVESEADFELDANYLIVAVHKDGNFTSALKNEPDSKGTRIGVEEVTITENTIVTDSDAIVWTIQAGAADGQYVLFNNAKSVYAAATKDDNVAQLLADGTDALAQWTLAFDAEKLPQVGIWSVSYPERWLARNSTVASAFFATYKGSQTAPRLYKKAASGPNVSLSASATEVGIGEELTITATAKNFSGDVTWAWEGTDGGTFDGATYTVNTAAEGEFTITAMATAGEETASKSITVTVATRYAVTVATGIANGTVEVDVAQAAAGDTVSVTATPADGYALEAITLNGEAIEGTTFTMPAEDVEVGATFREVLDYATLPFIAEDTPYSGPWKGATVDGMTMTGLGSDYSSTADGVGAKFDGTGDSIVIKFTGTPGVLSYGIKGNSLNETNVSTFVVQESADGETWSTLATYATGDNLTTSKAVYTNELSSDSQYVQFLYQTKGSGNVGIYDIYISGYSEPVPTVSVSGTTTAKLPDASFSLQFTLSNYEGTPTWAVTSGEGSIDSSTGLYTWTATADGTYGVTVAAMDGETEIASKTVSLTVEAADPAAAHIECAQGTAVTVAAGTELTLEFTAVNFTVGDGGWVISVNGTEVEASQVAEQSWTFVWTASEAGDYTIEAMAFDADYEGCSCTVAVTVTGDEPAGEPYIKGIAVDASAGTVTLTLADPTGKVRMTSDLTSWGESESEAATDGTLTIQIEGSPMFFGAP